MRYVGHGEEVLLAFPYDAALVGEAKAIDGCHSDWDTKTKLLSIHLVLAALVAAPQPQGRVLIVDELADSIGA